MTLNELINAVDLSGYISQYTELKWKNGELWGISPISHHDTDPSLSVRPDENVYCDFSSGSRGNIINFIMDFHHVDFRRAVEMLKEYANVTDEIVTSERLSILKEMSRYKERIVKKQTATHPILDESELEQYRVNDFPWWEGEDIDGSVAMAWGCGYDRYKDAITIPVRDNNGNLINILYRNMNPLRKEIGIPKYIYKHKLGALDFLWGWSVAADNIVGRNEVLLFEGAKSVIKSHLMGYPNAAAIMTSHMSDEQMRFLAQQGCDCILLLDKDQAYPERDDHIQKLKRFCRVYVCKDETGLLGEKDAPVDRGYEAFKTILAGRRRVR